MPRPFSLPIEINELLTRFFLCDNSSLVTSPYHRWCVRRAYPGTAHSGYRCAPTSFSEAPGTLPSVHPPSGPRPSEPQSRVIAYHRVFPTRCLTHSYPKGTVNLTTVVTLLPTMAQGMERYIFEEPSTRSKTRKVRPAAGGQVSRSQSLEF